MDIKSRFALCALGLVAACTSITQPCPPPSSGDVVYAVGRGWHTDIGIPVAELDENLKYFAQVYPGAKTIMFGYGKRTFVTAPPQTISEYFLGPVPGPAVVHVVGLKVTPPSAYPPEDVITLALPEGGRKKLSEYIWAELVKDENGKPEKVARSTNPDGMFYVAASEYNLLHTCNTWAVDVLHSAGLPLTSDGVIFSHQAMVRSSDAASSQCPFKP